MGSSKTKKSKTPSSSKSASSTSTQLTTSNVRADPILGYKIRVLLHDLRNLSKDTSSERRLNSTTDEHYISSSYFEPEQAALVKAAIVDVDIPRHLNPNAADDSHLPDGSQLGDAEPSSPSFCLRNQTLDAAIRAVMDNFLEKRRASGDARPCGPHDLAPIYAALFGIDLAELQNDDRFLSRVRRSGI